MNISNRPVRIVLGTVGILIFFMGIDIAFGGIRTLGWLGPNDFIEIVNPSDFKVQDNHFRFLGGTWIGIGIVFFSGAVAFQQLRIALVVLCGLIFVGGLARFSNLDFGTLASMSVLPSLLAELFIFPLLGYWITRSGERPVSSGNAT
jgi:hypothetical protein